MAVLAPSCQLLCMITPIYGRGSTGLELLDAVVCHVRWKIVSEFADPDQHSARPRWVPYAHLSSTNIYKRNDCPDVYKKMLNL
jgi:hypothetical protein